MADKIVILIIGAAGNIGKILVNGLKEKYILHGLDPVPVADMDAFYTGSTTDFDLMMRATKGVDAVIHLANVKGGKWEATLDNITGTYNVFEAARRNKVPRVVYSSRGGITPRTAYPLSVKRTIDMMPRPESLYSISKVMGESLGYMYSERFGLEVVCIRIGNCSPDRPLPEFPNQLSHRDAVHVYERAVIHPDVKFEVVFGVSDSSWDLYDVEHGRKAIGYFPEDKSILEPQVE